MKTLKQIFRIIHINFVLVKNGLDEVVLSIPVFAPLRFLAYLNPWNWHRNKKLTRAERIRKTLEELGPIFVKFGQMLSTRSDLLPEDIARELAKLQDQVPPFPGDIAIKKIEDALGENISNIFLDFDVTPLASASIAQVHAAKLYNDKKVVVKVLRPNIEKYIRQDVDLLETLARLAEKYWSHGKRVKPTAIVAEFKKTIIDELDLMREAANCSQLRRNFLNSELLYIPEVYWEYARSDVLVMERIYGIPISDMDALNAEQINIKKLAERGVEIFFTQVFRDSFFHADMHPGNIFVNPLKKDNPQYIAVDFGIMGSLNPSDLRYLGENFLAFFNRDYRRVAILHVQSGWVPMDTRIDEFESAIRTVCEPLLDKPLKDISFGQMLLLLIQTGRRFHMEIQPQLLLLQKTLVNIEGLGRRLYPDLDIWKVAEPLLEKSLKKQFGLRALASNIKEEMPLWVEKMPEVPMLLFETMQSVKLSNKLVQQNILQNDKKEKNNNTSNNIWFGIGLSFLLVAIFNTIVFDKQWFTTNITLLMTLGFGVFAMVMLLVSLIRKQ